MRPLAVTLLLALSGLAGCAQGPAASGPSCRDLCAQDYGRCLAGCTTRPPFCLLDCREDRAGCEAACDTTDVNSGDGTTR